MTPVEKTLIVFVISVVVTFPLMFIANHYVDSAPFRTVIISALGWFAGGAMVGTYTYLRK